VIARGCAGVVALCIVPLATMLAQAAVRAPELMLRERLTAFAHDSMEGRATGTRGHARAVAYLIETLRRTGVHGAGKDGGYVQDVPIVRRQLDITTARAWDNGPYIAGFDFLPITGGRFGLTTPDSARVGPAVYVAGGRIGAPNAASPGSVKGKFVVFEPPKRPEGSSDYQLWHVRDALMKYRDAAAIFVATFDLMPRSVLAELTAPRDELSERVAAPPRTPPIIAVTRGVAQKAFGSTAAGPSYVVRALPLDAGTQNVVAMIEGSDPVLRDSYVVLSARSDHLGISDSIERAGADSIFNGANESGAGSVALLAIAERVAALPVKPKRTLVFLWAIGGEQGLLGAEFFADSPTVTRAQIVANINVDAIGAGAPHLIGANRLSEEFSRWIAGGAQQFGVPQIGEGPRGSAFCDTEDWHFNRWGIPSASVSAPNTAHTRSVTDDVSRIDFVQYARSVAIVEALALDIANRSASPRVDKAKPDPRSLCVR
jgi:hypothetical protein